MKKFKVGVNVVLVTGKYGITKVGWRGTVYRDGPTQDGMVFVKWKQDKSPLLVYAKDLRIIGRKTFVAYNAKNRPEGL